MGIDLVKDYWESWYKAGELERLEIVGSLPLFKDLEKLPLINAKPVAKALVSPTLINSYFENLADFMEGLEQPPVPGKH